LLLLLLLLFLLVLLFVTASLRDAWVARRRGWQLHAA